ncbi:MAG: hypothetical protein K2Q34_05170 [Alphaproteobacteria bacterium]|nr:hypothetical protein [Alphaproteobacteria bacterium]
MRKILILIFVVLFVNIEASWSADLNEFYIIRQTKSFGKAAWTTMQILGYLRDNDVALLGGKPKTGEFFLTLMQIRNFNALQNYLDQLHEDLTSQNSIKGDTVEGSDDVQYGDLEEIRMYPSYG